MLTEIDKLTNDYSIFTITNTKELDKSLLTPWYYIESLGWQRGNLCIILCFFVSDGFACIQHILTVRRQWLKVEGFQKTRLAGMMITITPLEIV